MLKLLLPFLLLLAQGARGDDLTWMAKPKPYRGLFGNPAGTVSHVWFDGAAVRDALKKPWAMAGTVPMVAAAGSLPAGAGPYSDANYFKLDPLGTGADDLDFTGDWFGAVLYVPTTVATAHVPFSNGVGASAGYYLQQATTTTLTFQTMGTGGWNGAINSSTIVTPGVVNFLCVGRNGDAVALKINQAATQTYTPASGTYSPGTARQMRLGNYTTGGNAVPGVIYEAIWGTAPGNDATCAALYSAALSRLASARSVVMLGDSLTQLGRPGTGQTPYPAQLQPMLPAGWLTFNGGWSSETSTQCLGRWTNTYRAHHHGTVSVLIGINDIVTNQTAASVWANIQTIADQARADGVHLMLWTVTPFKASTYYTVARETQRAALNTLIRDYVVAHPEVVLVDAGADFDDGTQTLKAAYAFTDWLHWSDAGITRAATLAYNAAHAAAWW